MQTSDRHDDTDDNLETGDENRPRCLNCEKKLPKKATFCPKCGQRNNQGKASMSELFKRFWNNFSHLDSKFVKMCWQLFLPARVTLEYFRGRQKRYPHPVQFFLVVMFFFLLLFNSKMNSNRLSYSSGGAKAQIQISNDTLQQPKKTAKVSPDELYLSMQRYVARQEIRAGLDSLPPELRSPDTRRALDTLLRNLSGDWETIIRAINYDSSGKGRGGDSIPLNLVTYRLWVAPADLVKLEPTELAKKYGITGWKERLFLIQGVKTFKDPKSLIRAYTASLSWTILALIALMAGVLALFFWKQKRFYVEHFVFLLHQHSSAFLLITLVMLLDKFLSVGLWWLPVFGLISTHLFFSMRNFYGEKTGWTLLKWFFYNWLYLVGFFVLFTVGMIAVFISF